MADTFMYISIDDTQNYPFCRNFWTINLMNQPIKIQESTQSSQTNKKSLV